VRRALLSLLVSLLLLLSFAPAFQVSTAAGPAPIRHLVFIVQENHSFDNHFGTYPGVIGYPLGTAVPLDPNATASATITPFHLNVSQPILIVGDELPPGVANPDELNTSTPNSNSRRCPPSFSSTRVSAVT
jgi:phospholipase C